MNSYVETLFHIPRFREVVLNHSIKSHEKPLSELKLLFQQMKSRSTPSTDLLMNSFDWPPEKQHFEMDIHQFSLELFDQIQQDPKSIVNKFFGKLQLSADNPASPWISPLKEISLHFLNASTLTELLDSYFKPQEVTITDKFSTEKINLKNQSKTFSRFDNPTWNIQQFISAKFISKNQNSYFIP